MVFIPTDDGQWVDENYERLARVIGDFYGWAGLELRWIPPAHRTRDDNKPYCVFDTKTQQPVLFASELDTPEDILEQLFMADNSKGDVLARMEARNDAAQALAMKEHQDRLAEAHDKAKFLLASPLHRIRMDGKKWDSEDGWERP